MPWCQAPRAPSSVRLRWLDAISTCPWPWRASSPALLRSVTRPWPTGSRGGAQSVNASPANVSRAAVPPLRERPGAEVLVVGGMVKSVTLYAVAAALAAGARRVRYIDSDERSLAAAAALGAEVTEHHGPWPRHFDRALITVDGTG